MDPVKTKEIEEALATLKAFREQGKITDNDYFKGVVSLSYEYCVRQEILNTVSLLSECPSTYFTGAMKDQMMADDTFFEVALYLADFLVNNKVVTLESPELRPTQKGARA